MVKLSKERLIEALINSKLIAKEGLERAINKQKKKGGSLSKILIDDGLATEKELMGALGRELNIPPINLSRYNIDKSLTELIPERIAKQYNLIPISKLGNRLSIAMSDPLNIFAVDDIKMLTGYEIDLVIAPENDIKEMVKAMYQEGIAEMSKLAQEAEQTRLEEVEIIEREQEKIDFGAITQEDKKTPIIKIVNLIVKEAIKKRASDIHIEPEDNGVRIRYRIDGVLQEVLKLPKRNQNAVITRLKIMSNLNITESRLPQDGRFKIRMGAKEIDFRVSILPISHGGKVVLRALDKSNLSIGLEELGFLPGPLKNFQDAIKKPFGMILVTGPTGSGKSTTLYSILNQLNTPKRNIITIEDPVEYQVDGITQVQAKPEIGLNFASGLKSLLRQSPDVIMIGEIRDGETADIAIKAALTGELVFSTLHTNDAAGAITRLIDMGIEPFLIASSLIMVAAQRLCRKICEHCKEEYDVPKAVLERVGIEASKRTKPFFHGKGCKKCNNTGYLGRIGTLETLPITDEIREMIINRAPSGKIRDFAVKKQGMKLLRDNAFAKFLNGMTTLEEVLRITSEE